MSILRIYDLSPTLSGETAVFPGDQKFERSVSMAFEAGHHLTLSSIRSTVHAGSHADAPNHYCRGGVGIDRVSLEPYIGECLVVHSKVKQGERVGMNSLSETARKVMSSHTCPKRILFRTGTFPNPDVWNPQFASLDPNLIASLAEKGVKLVGIDTPSIDPETSKALESHSVVARESMSILEGLCLESVPEGIYFLSAAPIKIQDGDSGFVRAVLIDGLQFDRNASFLGIECDKTRSR